MKTTERGWNGMHDGIFAQFKHLVIDELKLDLEDTFSWGRGTHKNKKTSFAVCYTKHVILSHLRCRPHLSKNGK